MSSAEAPPPCAATPPLAPPSKRQRTARSDDPAPMTPTVEEDSGVRAQRPTTGSVEATSCARGVAWSGA
jgi:hypothetical protein